MELNGDIIRQLYNEMTSQNRTYLSVEQSGKGLSKPTFSAKPPCLKAFYQFFAAVSEAFPEYNLLLDNIVVTGDKVMARYIISGIHRGDFMGLTATNEQMAITGIDIFCLDRGQIIEYWDAAHQITASSKQIQDLPGTERRGTLIGITPKGNSQVSLVR